MCIESWSENIILVSLPGEPGAADELADVAALVDDRGDCDVVVDCSLAGRMSCSSYRQLLELNNALSSCGHQLVLCGPERRVRGVLDYPALAQTLIFAGDRFTALTGLGFSRA
jgi:anti-anti-sigma regulatory factor